MPVECRAEVGFALNEAQLGGTSVAAKPLGGFGGVSVLEIVTGSRDGAFRVVYTVRFARALFVLHAFQKKSKRGIATPREELERVRSRLRDAEEHYAELYPDD